MNILALPTARIPRQKLQINYLIFGMISMAFVGMIIHLSIYFLKLGWPIFFLASPYSILVSFFFAIALIKYRLLDYDLSSFRRGSLRDEENHPHCGR